MTRTYFVLALLFFSHLTWADTLWLNPDGTIYCVDQVTGLWAVDGNNHIEKWAVTPGASWQGSLCYPVITDNRVILGALNDPNLYAFNASTGQPLWAVDLTRDAGTETWSEPAVGPGGTLYASLNDGYLRAVNPDGQRLWTTRLGHSRGSTLCVDADGTIFAAGDDGLLTVLNPDGHIIARFDAGMPLSYPVITDDHTLLVSGVQGQGLTLSAGVLIALSPYVVCDPLDLAPVTASNP